MKARKEIADYIKTHRLERARVRVRKFDCTHAVHVPQTRRSIASYVRMHVM